MVAIKIKENSALLRLLSYKPQNLGLTGLSRKGFGIDKGSLRFIRKSGELDLEFIGL